MFDSSLIESANLQRQQGGWLTALVSFLVHCLIIGAVVAAGMYVKTNPQVIERPIEAFMVAAAPPPPPPPSGGVSHAQSPQIEVPKRPQNSFVTPTQTPQTLPKVQVEQSAASGQESGVVGGVEGGVAGGVVGGAVGGVLGGQLGGTGDRAFRVGGDVKPPEVINRVEPSYSEVARRARIQGVVLLEAIIDSNGNVTDVRVLKPLELGLDQQAMNAVKEWKFRPGTLNGQPVPVIFSLTIYFRLQ